MTYYIMTHSWLNQINFAIPKRYCCENKTIVQNQNENIYFGKTCGEVSPERGIEHDWDDFYTHS